MHNTSTWPFLFLSSVTFSYIYNEQTDPYMDEIFHVPQAKTYCAGNFSYWDPMITTLPGLYLVSVGILVPLGKIFGENIDDLCSVVYLRAINTLFAVGNFYVIYAIMCKLHEKETVKTKIAMTTLTLSLLPLLFFFNFLYYTDVGSTFCVLFMYLLHLHDNKFLASAVGAIAVLFRQTNIIWVIFMAGLTARSELTEWIKIEQNKMYGRKSIKEEIVNEENLTLRKIFTLLRNSVMNKNLQTFYLTIYIIKASQFYIIIILTFLGFVYFNGGIVVGDRSHHTACLNFPQLFYFISFTSVFAFPFIFLPRQIILFLKYITSNYIKLFILMTVSFLLIHYFTYVHLYLISDNRHYTFYIWGRLYNRHQLVKFLLVPFYLYSYWSFSALLGQRDTVWKIVFGICLLAATVPQKLLEFRYFIIPYLIFRLNIKQGSWLQLCAEILFYLLVNFVTVYLFINKPFKWDNSSDVQRFMW